MRGNTDLDYTWYGVLVTDCDALLVLEKCLRGELAHIPRRPHDSERARLIKSGSIFVYESNASGIKRWTDGINWSPSRILTNFLVYHELEKAPPPGEKKRAIKRKRSETDFEDADPKGSQRTILEQEWSDDDRRLMGSPQDNYGWKIGGLVKKTYSFDFRGASHHIISYFNPADVRSGELKRPIHCTEFQETFIRPELVDQGARSRNPVTEAQIEQQRWERPLYAIDSNVSLMRQYPLQTHVPFAQPPPPVDYTPNRTPLVPHHGLVHRSSIHFPMESGLYTATSTQSYQQSSRPTPHIRQSSMSAVVDDGFQRGMLRDQLVRNSVGPIDSSSGDQFSAHTFSHARSHSAVLQSPPDTKPAVYDDETLPVSTYSSVGPQGTRYAVASPPMAMPAIDTSYSHSIARPVLYQGPHSTTNVHPPVDLHVAPGPPPTKRGRMEATYSHLSPTQWAPATPTTNESSIITPDQAHYNGQMPMESYSFAPAATSFTATHSNSYPSTQEHALYSDVGTGYGVSQAQPLFAPPAYSSYSQLTAHS